MGTLSALRQNVDVAARSTVIPPSNIQDRTTNVDATEYAGVDNTSTTTPTTQIVKPVVQKKGFFTPDKTQGFVDSFIHGADTTGQVQESTAGKVGDVLGSVVRVPADKAVHAGLELFSGDVKRMRDSIDTLRKTDPELAGKIEYDSGFGERKTTTQNVVQGAAGIGELALTLLPIGLLGKAGRLAISAKEAQALGKFGKFGATVLKGTAEGASLGSKVLHGSTISGAYGGLYGFLAGLEDGGDWEKAFKNVPMYTAAGAALGGFVPGVLGATAKVAGAGLDAARGVTSFVSKVAPTEIRPSTYFNKLPSSIQRAILTEGSYLKGKFGDIGESVVNKFNTARKMMNSEIGNFQDEATRLGMLDAPSTASGAYKDVAGLREKWKNNRDFRFAVRDALNHDGVYQDPVVRAQALKDDPHMNDIVTFFDKYRKDRGLLAQQSGITDNLLDIDKYFSKYTPEVGLSNKVVKQLAAATNDVEREAIYRTNSPVVDDMIEYGFRRGQWKTKVEGFKNYYDAMDSALNLGRVSDNENSYFNWLVENGHAQSLEQARQMYIGDLDNMRRPLTQRAASLDYERKTPMPWSDPDPMRVMGYYVKKSDERIAMASQFGVNDEVLTDMKKAIAMSNQGKAAADDFEKAIRSITGQVDRAPAELRFSAIVRGIETFHLAFSQILNVSTQLNYLLASDLKHWAYGFKKAFEQEGMRDSVRKGVFVSDMIRQTTPYSNFGDDVVDRILRYSGFSYTEMLNRATGVGVSQSWAKYNFNKALAKMGKTVLPEDAQTGINLLKNKKVAEGMILRRGYENTGKYAREFAAKFPGEDFAPVAGNIGLAQKRLDGLEASIAPKIKKLQGAKDILEKKMVEEGKPLTDQNVMDLQESINTLRESINSFNVSKGGAPAEAQTFTDSQIKQGLDGVVKLRRSKMEKMIDGLEAQLDEARAAGQQDKVVTPAVKPLTPEQKVASYHTQVQDINEAIVSLQNELSDKERLLNGIVDGYKIADTQIRKEFPQGFLYDKHIETNKATLGKIPAEEAANLRELGIDPEEALARGGLSDGDFTGAAQQMVESTQGGNNPLSLPGMSRTPMGKVFFQFKSFSYMQMSFVQKQFLKDIVSKDTRGIYNAVKLITTLGGLYPLTYGALRDIRDIVTLKKDPKDAFHLTSYFQGVGLFSAGGLYTDFLKSLQKGDVIRFAAGPTFGDVEKYLTGIGQLSTLNATGFKTLAKQFANQTGIGNILNNTLLK